MQEFTDKDKNEQLQWIVNYLVDEDFSHKHLATIKNIVGLFNYCTESEKEIYDFEKKIYDKYIAYG